MATSKIRLKKICAWCGNEFEAQKISTQFCEKKGKEERKKAREKETGGNDCTQ